MKQGLILFAHGSREPEWAKPFEKLAALLRSTHEVRIAYLERMQPSLEEAIAQLVERKVDSIRIVPVFLGMGAHVREDLPRLVAAANPPVKITIDPPIGEQGQVLDAIAAAIAASPARGARASS